MIRVGHGKPRLIFIEAHNDMSHFTPSHYVVNDYHYMTVPEYIDKKEFSSFNMKPNLSKEEINNIVSRTVPSIKTSLEEDIINSLMMHPWEAQIKRLINKSKGMLWQYDAVNMEMNGYVRNVVALGSNSLQRWSFHDAYIVYPALMSIANTLNKLRKYKTDKEWADWETFLNKKIGKSI